MVAKKEKYFQEIESQLFFTLDSPPLFFLKIEHPPPLTYPHIFCPTLVLHFQDGCVGKSSKQKRQKSIAARIHLNFQVVVSIILSEMLVAAPPKKFISDTEPVLISLEKRA